jgi:transcriptional regulator NrdR family protein
MHCINCNGTTRVIRSTRAEAGLIVRVRQCCSCAQRYQTEECIVGRLDAPVMKQPDIEQRRAERERWHQQLSTNLTIERASKE